MAENAIVCVLGVSSFVVDLPHRHSIRERIMIQYDHDRERGGEKARIDGHFAGSPTNSGSSKDFDCDPCDEVHDL